MNSAISLTSYAVVCSNVVVHNSDHNSSYGRYCGLLQISANKQGDNSRTKWTRFHVGEAIVDRIDSILLIHPLKSKR